MIERGMVWPIGIAVGLLLVIAVNFGFAWIASRNAPVIESSYQHATQR